MKLDRETMQPVHFFVRALLWVIALGWFITAAAWESGPVRQLAIGLAFGAVSEVMSVMWIATRAYWKP